jgi:HK97 family phage major capsid protein
LFGDFSKFKVREVSTVRLVNLRERYAEYDQQGIIMWFRFDSMINDAGTHPLIYAAQHA